MSPARKAWLEIHLATLLFGCAGLFAKFTDLPALWIVFGRVLFAAVALAFVIKLKRASFRLLKRSDLFVFMALGGTLALHWFTFFHSIQISTVAIGLLSFSTFPIFTTFLEPLVFKEKLALKAVLTAFVTFIGVALIVPELDLSNNMTQGVIWGTVSGFTFAIISILNRKYAHGYSGSVMAFYQDGFACLALLPFILASGVMPAAGDWMLLVLLGVVFTAIAHTVFINSMRVIKAQQASIIVSLEPVYGIIFALILLSEVPDLKTIAGGGIILSAALFTSMSKG